MSQAIINNRFLEESVFAIADGYCVINLTKNIVRGSMYQVVNGKKYNLNEQLGLPENSSLQSLVDAWALTIPEEGLQDFLHEFDRERLLKRFENGERHISFRYWTRTATFEPMLAEDHMALYRKEETGDIIAVNYVLDRTEHYRLEEKERALEKSNREYAKLLEEEKKHTAMIEELTKKLQSQLELFTVSIPGGVKISNDDPEYSFKYVSEQFANMLGYKTPKELIEASSGSILGLAHPDDIEFGLADALNQYTYSDHYATIYRIRCKDGTYKYIEDRGQKVVKEDETIEHWNLMLDKNDFMHKSIELESEKKANKSKSDFLSRMSHDMRTPLNGIIGLLQIAERRFDDKDLLLESHKKMQVAANYLLSLINDVLQMSKIEDGNVPLTKDIIDIIEQRAKERGIKMQFNAKNDIRYPFVYGSPVHLRQIFLNIYGNCIKYNHIGGSILTTSDYTETDDGVVMYEWTITDTGIGMSKEYKEHIFEPFSQERQYIGSTHYGIGLGMSIVKGLIEKMGGSIEVESEEGVGSTFIIKIPFKIASTPYKVNKQTSEIKIDELNLLLVEDNELNAEIAETLLSDEGAVVTVAKDGLQAVNIFKEKPEGSFDAILMDIMMPVMDGLTATKKIRTLNHPDAKKIPIIAMTANAFKEDKEKCLTAGMNAHLAKPIEIENVKKVLCEQIR
jgi:signal transduction histidine kinase/ActR/RegA family two-component response regulator